MSMHRQTTPCLCVCVAFVLIEIWEPFFLLYRRIYTGEPEAAESFETLGMGGGGGG